MSGYDVIMIEENSYSIEYSNNQYIIHGNQREKEMNLQNKSTVGMGVEETTGSNGAVKRPRNKLKTEKQQSNEFIRKLYTMLENNMYPNIVQWTDSGESFVIINTNEFTTMVLPIYFKHSNFSSFIRQLNKYDFHKVKRSHLEKINSKYGPNSWEFQHRFFKNGGLDLLKLIKRKIAAPSATATSSSATPSAITTPTTTTFTTPTSTPNGSSSITTERNSGVKSTIKSRTNSNENKNNNNDDNYNKEEIDGKKEEVVVEEDNKKSNGLNRMMAGSGKGTNINRENTRDVDMKDGDDEDDNDDDDDDDDDNDDDNDDDEQVDNDEKDNNSNSPGYDQYGKAVKGKKLSSKGPLKPRDMSVHKEIRTFFAPKFTRLGKRLKDSEKAIDYLKTENSYLKLELQKLNSRYNTMLQSMVTMQNVNDSIFSNVYALQQQVARQQQQLQDLKQQRSSSRTSSVHSHQTDPLLAASTTRTTHPNILNPIVPGASPTTAPAAATSTRFSLGVSDFFSPSTPNTATTSATKATTTTTNSTATNTNTLANGSPALNSVAGSTNLRQALPVGSFLNSDFPQEHFISGFTGSQLVLTDFNTPITQSNFQHMYPPNDQQQPQQPQQQTYRNQQYKQSNAQRPLSPLPVHQEQQNKNRLLNPQQQSRHQQTPLHQNVYQQPPLAAAVQNTIRPAEWKLKTGYRVLLVEDDNICIQVCSKFLTKYGCTVDVATDGLNAINTLERNRYDLVLMDIVMPNLDGATATSIIRAFDNETPIIAMTGNIDDQDLVTYLQNGMTDILAKPFTKNDLYSMLTRYLKNRIPLAEQSQDDNNSGANRDESKSDLDLDIDLDILDNEDDVYDSKPGSAQNSRGSSYSSNKMPRPVRDDDEDLSPNSAHPHHSTSSAHGLY